MRVYKVVWCPGSTEFDSIQWLPTEAAYKKRKTELKRTLPLNGFVQDDLCGPVDIPTKKPELLAWLNANHKYSYEEV